MKEHPIPQDITNYRFHIIGSMTLKQFLEIGGGILLAGIIYKTGLPVFIKWPALIFSALLGAAAAFLPIEERPLDHWITTYFQVLFKPTQFFWRRVPKIPSVFDYKPNSNQPQRETDLDLTPVKRERIKEYMASLHQTTLVVDPYEQQLQQRINDVLTTFQQVDIAVPKTTQAIVEKPDLTPRVRTLRKADSLPKNTGEDMTSTVLIHSSSRLATHQFNQSDDDAPLPEIEMKHPMDTQLSPEQVAQFIRVEDAPLIKVADKEEDAQVIAQTQTKSLNQDELKRGLHQTPESQPDLVKSTGAATFNTNLPFPNIPSEPNKLVGMVLTKNGELIPGAVIEVRNNSGAVERAVKSNALGQFFITTPLKTGRYIVSVESDSFQFHPVTLLINDTVLQPLELRALT